MIEWRLDPEGKTFVNPYNFISIKDHECKREEFKKGDLSGVINCKLISRTPIIIPNSSNENAFGEKVLDDQGEEIKDEYGKNVAKTYNFFSYNDLSIGNKELNDPKGCYEPVIPGSEIRGVIRSAYEAITNSCLSTIDIDRDLHQRTPKVKRYAGQLIKQLDEQNNEQKKDVERFLITLNDKIISGNQSIFAHGSKIIISEEFDEFEKVALDALKYLCICENINLDEYYR